MPETELVNITINGIDLQVPKGEKVIESARRIGVEIPFFCYHPRLSMENGANCRMCLVEVGAKRANPDGSVTVAKNPKPQASCSLPATEGMVVETETDQIVKDRRGVLEFLLINHPLDCPICDRGGECPLQNNALQYGPQTSRYIEEKRHFPKAYLLSEHVVFDRERCIHCARCTRFTSDISGDSQLDFLFRGADMEVSTVGHTRFQSKFSGNVIELCPVGALLSRDYRFKARPWDLVTQKSICTRCSNGCNIKLDYRLSGLERVNARVNEAVNEEWTCDRGKFGMGYVSSEDRLKTPLIRHGDRFVPATWDEALGLVAEKLKEAGSAVGGIGGSRSSNEDLYVFQRLFREALRSNNLDHRMGPHFGPTAGGLYGRLGYHTMGDSIASLENMKSILVFGSDLVDEQPIVFLRVRKAWRFHGASVVEAVPTTLDTSGRTNHVRDFASLSLRYKPGTEPALLRGLRAAAAEEEPGGGRLADGWTPARAADECGVPESDLRKAARLLAVQPMAILAGQFVDGHPNRDEVLTALADFAVATGNAAHVNLPVTEVNAQGAMDMGILPDALPGYVEAPTPGLNTEQMLKSTTNKTVKALWVAGVDVANAYHDPTMARAALERCKFLVVTEMFMTDTAKMADVVLPIQSIAERDGTITNCERRVQRFHKAFEIDPQIQPEWLVYAQLAGRLGLSLPYFSTQDITRDIAANVPIYSGCSPEALGDEGVRWEYPVTVTPAR